MKNGTHVNGNKDAVQFLESLTAYAKENPVGYVAAVMCQDGPGFTGGFVGTVELELRARASLDELGKMMDKNEVNRTNEIDSNLDASYVCYNVTKSPVSYDFIAWLIDQDMERKAQNIISPLKVGFFFGRDGKTGMGDEYRQLMLNEVCRPAMEMIGAEEDPVATQGKFKEFFSFKYTVENFNKGIPLTKFKSTKVLKDYKPRSYVTITLREADHWPHRNSKLKEWTKFATWLETQGERVVFVRDTVKADERIEGFETFPEASKDLYARVALYQNAKCNMFVANGPGALCFFGDAPWLGFFEIDDEGAYNAAKTVFWKECCGVEVGNQFPWSTDKQQIVWQPDYYTNLVLAWKKLDLNKKETKNGKK